MKKRLLTSLMLIAMLLPMVVGVGPTLADASGPALINELLASHSGTDDTEFVEFFGVWSADDLREFEESTAVFGEVDPEDWQ